MDRNEMRRFLIDWLDDHHHFGEAEQKIGHDDASFLDNGVLDSLGFVALIVTIEDSFGIRIDRKNLNRENFDSVNLILDYVTNRIEARQ